MATTHFIFCLFGTGGDLYPCTPVVAELARRGHHVTVTANPHFRHVFEGTGAEFIPVGTAESYLSTVQDARQWGPQGIAWSLQSYLGESIAPVFRLIQARLHQQPVVIATRNAFGAYFAQQEFGIRLHTVLYAPAFLVSEGRFPYPYNEGFWRAVPRGVQSALSYLSDRLITDRQIVPALNAWRSRLGLKPLKSFIRGSMKSLIAFYPSWYDDLAQVSSPEIFQGDFVFYHNDEKLPLPQPIERFLAAGPAPIVFTFGTGIGHVKETYAAAAAALRSSGRRGIFLSTFAQNFPADLPENILAFGYADLGALLPRSEMLVHHGGIGTAAQAMLAGVPQLVLPVAYDQPDNGHRIRQLDLGDMLESRPDAQAMHRAIENVIDGVDRQKLRQVRQRLRSADGANRNADICERIAA
jgi:rhamnosyltransferase subunit B